MQSDALTKAPKLFHRVAAIFIAAITATGFGLGAYALWQPDSKGENALSIFGWIFAGLSMLSLVLLYRALFTPSRSPTRGTVRIVSVAFLVMGLGGLAIAALAQAPGSRLLILASSTACISHGLNLREKRQ